jgi:hypothetical protein
MIHRVMLAGLLTLVFVARVPAQADAPDTVRLLAGHDRLVFHGCNKVSEHDVRAAMASDWPVQLAAAPSLPLKSYLDMLQERLLAGYMASGFPQAKVSATMEGGAAGHIVVDVNEGPRYVAGTVRVTGDIANVPVDRLVTLLTQGQPAGQFSASLDEKGVYHITTALSENPKRPTWTGGLPAPFEATIQDRLLSDVEDTLAQLGFFAGQCTVEVKPEASGNKADLCINLRSVSPRATIEQIDVVGCRTSKSDEVLKLIGLAPGQQAGIADLLEAQRRLWESGRFYKHVITSRFTDGRSRSRLAVRIDVSELPGLPPVSQPLSDTDQALLRCRKWLLGRQGAGEDVVISFHTKLTSSKFDAAECRLVVGGRGGALRLQLAQAPSTRPSANKLPSSAIDVGVALTPVMAGFYAISDQRKFVATSRGTIHPKILIAIEPDEDQDANRKWDTKMSGGIQVTGSAGPLVSLVLECVPASILDVAHRAGVRARNQDGKLLVDNGPLHLRADAATGRLIECQYHTEDGSMWELAARRGALAEEIAGLDGASKDALNTCDPQRPIASLAAFSLDEAIRSPWLQPDGAYAMSRGSAVVSQLLGPTLFESLDRVMADATWDDWKFHIPVSITKGNGLQQYAMMGIPYLDVLFDRGTWPWTLARAKLLLFCQQTDTLQPELDRLLNTNRLGPVGFAVASKVFKPLSAQAATLLAQRGLGILEPDHFGVDIDEVVNGNQITAQSLRRAAEGLRQLPDVDADALASALPPNAADIVRQLRAGLKARADEPIERALPEALKLLWIHSLCADTEAELRRMVNAQ